MKPIYRETRRWCVIVLSLAVLLPAVASGQNPQEKFQLAQRENAQALRKYEWKSRTEIRKAGEPKGVQLMLMRYDIDGNLQKTTIGGTPPPSIPTRGLRGRIAERKKKDFQETIQDLRRVAAMYSELSPSQMQNFMVGRRLGSTSDEIQIQGRDVLQRGDSITIYVDAGSHRQRRIEIATFIEGDSVRITSEFRDIADGPNYMARSIVDYPQEKIQLLTENFDYQRVRP